MLLRLAAALLLVLGTCTAHAQFGNIFGNSRPSRAIDDGPPPPTPEALSRAMAKLREYGANVDRACAESFAARFSKGLPELVGSIRSPDDGTLQQLKLDCGPRPPYERRLAAPANGDDTVARLVDWVRSSLLSRREFVSSFAACRTIVSSYQDFLLANLNDRTEAARSRAVQQKLTEKGQALRANRDVDVKVACLKKILADLRLNKTTSHIGDQLSSLNGNLEYTLDDLPLKAKMTFEDLTDVAQKEFAAGLSLSKIDQKQLHAVVNIGTEAFPHPQTLTACLLPFRWVDWFMSRDQCHGLRLEAALYKAVSRLD